MLYITMSVPIIYRYVLGGNKIIFKTGGLTIFFSDWTDVDSFVLRAN